MQKFNVSGQETAELIITQSTERLVLDNIPVDAKIKVTVEKEGFDVDTRIPTLPIGHVLELQDKADDLAYRNYIERVVENQLDTNDDNVKCVSKALLKMSIIGEVDLTNDTDRIVVKLTDLQNIKENATITAVEGLVKEQKPIRYTKIHYLASNDEKQADLFGVSLLGFIPSEYPDEVQINYGGEVKKIDKFLAETINQQNFSCVRSENGARKFGTVDCVVLDVSLADKVILRDETQANNFNVTAVKVG